MKRKLIIYALSVFFLSQAVFISKLNAQSCCTPFGSSVIDGANLNAINSIAYYNGKIVVAAGFSTIAGTFSSNVFEWNGTAWSVLGSGINVGNNGSVVSLIVYNGELYAAGIFDTAGGMRVNNIAKWNGSIWSPVGSGIPLITGQNEVVNALVIYNNALYAGGLFDTAGESPANNIAKWDGSSWSPIGEGIGNGEDAVIYCMTYSGILYVGGQFNTAGNVSVLNIAQWNDTAWSTLNGGIGNSIDFVYAIAGFQGNIYAGGLLYGQSGSTMQYIGMWDGATWTNIDSAVVPNDQINDLFVFDGNLIVAGNFSTNGSSSLTNIAQWNGTTWSTLGCGFSGDNNWFSVIDTFNGNLYIGGQFYENGDNNEINLVQYSCPAYIQEIPSTSPMHVYPNPSTGILNIVADNLQDKPAIQIYNLFGQKILQSGLDIYTTEINLTGEASGTYLYRVTNEEGDYLCSGSFVLQ